VAASLGKQSGEDPITGKTEQDQQAQLLAHEPQQMALVIIIIKAMPRLCGVNIVSP
jgi:hypothetical protein